MATVNVMKNKRTQSRAGLAFILSYCKRESKTVHEGRKLVSGVNCLPESAYQEFMNTKLQYGKSDGKSYAKDIAKRYGLSFEDLMAERKKNRQDV